MYRYERNINNFIGIIYYAYMKLGLNVKKINIKKIHNINIMLPNLFISHLLLNNIFVIINKILCDNYLLY